MNRATVTFHEGAKSNLLKLSGAIGILIVLNPQISLFFSIAIVAILVLASFLLKDKKIILSQDGIDIERENKFIPYQEIVSCHFKQFSKVPFITLILKGKNLQIHRCADKEMLFCLLQYRLAINSSDPMKKLRLIERTSTSRKHGNLIAKIVAFAFGIVALQAFLRADSVFSADVLFGSVILFFAIGFAFYYKPPKI